MLAMEYSSNDVKQLFRSVYTLVKQQDERKATLTVSAVLANDFLEEHRQLVGRCVTLIFEDFETVGRKAREILWRKGYYDLIAIFKKHHQQLQQQRKQMVTDARLDEKEQMLKKGAERLLLDGMNHLKVIVLRFAQIFNLDNLRYLVSYGLLENYDDELLVRESSCYENLHLKDKRSDDEKKVIYTKQEISFALESIHSLLTALGDLHRYYCEFGLSGVENVRELTAGYYWEAFKLNTKIGITQNQLGMLYNGHNYNLDSVYHYLYSLCTSVPFECSELNVNKIFQKNIRYLETNGGEDVEEEDYAVREFMAKFLLVVDVFFYDKTVTDFTNLCHSVLFDFKNVLGARKLVDDEYYITDDIIFKIVSVLFFCMYKIKLNSSNKIYSLNAFLVALCSELLEYCTMAAEKYMVENVREDKRFREQYMAMYQKYDENVRKSRQSVKEGSPVLAKDQRSSSGVEDGNGSEDHSNKENEDGDKKSQTSSKHINQKKKYARRRRRAVSDESESDLSDAEDDSDFQMDSESEDEDAVSSVCSFESYDDFSDEDEEEIQQNDSRNEANGVDDDKSFSIGAHRNGAIDKATDENLNDQPAQLKFKKRYHKLNPNIIIEFAEQERTMRSLKLLFDWLHDNIDILVGCYQSNPEFLHNIMKLLNHYNIDIFSNRYYFPRQLITVQGVREDFRSLFEARRTIPLEEDIAMKRFPLFDSAQEGLDWETNYRLEISGSEHSFLRVMKMVDFGFFLCKSKKFEYAYCPKARDFGLKSKKQHKQGQRKNEDQLKLNSTKGTNRRTTRKREQREERRRIRKQYEELELRGETRSRHNRDRKRQQHENRSVPSIEGHKSSQEGEFKSTPMIIAKKGYLKNKANGAGLLQRNTEGSRKNNDFDEAADETHQEKNINELMGQLWLRNEVKTLESKVRRVVNITLTPYLMLDSKCLTEYTSIVKNLVKTKKFVILIPTAVLSDLDELKKHSDGARNAIKWLEFEFSKGNRFLRSQKNHEMLPMPLIRIPKKMDRGTSVFHQIVQFCNHIVSNHADKDCTDIITYLHGDSLQDKKLHNSSFIGILEAIPVKFEHIVTFYSSYKRK
ncbi:nonsense-mediated mRNA decay factor SMG5 [Toxorhynchites rutilus septentrionalis]|uniref:nonsense-mediated mRNA decay factor SMG5 n=1 Tax=Toxorhynchites rutilus septentrionalis TaxID=329112 RepID=UPI002478A11E|nr:nonsense-mediated mRNA decay factor SMG5 [Toxorhynchites rutilus septentrionalis]